MPPGVSPTEYRIVARIVAKYDPGAGETAAGRGADKVKKRIDNSLSARFFSSIGSRMAGLFTGAAVLYGMSRLASGIGSITSSLVDMNAQLQDSKAGLASLFTANFGTPIESSLRMSEHVMKKLRHDAAVGVGELSDYLETYQMLLTPALQGGSSLAGVERLTKLTVAAGAASGRPGGMKLAGLDVIQALQSGAHARTMQVLGPLLMATGMNFEKFNALSMPKRLEALTEALEKLAPGADLMGQGWTAQTGTFKDLIRQFALAGSSGLFERMTAGLRGLNRWLTRNVDSISRFFEGVGGALTGMWDVGSAFVRATRPYLPGLLRQLEEMGERFEHLGGSMRGYLTNTTMLAIAAGFLDGTLKSMTSSINGLIAYVDYLVIAFGFLQQVLKELHLFVVGLNSGLPWLTAGKPGATRMGNAAWDYGGRAFDIVNPRSKKNLGGDNGIGLLNRDLEAARVQVNIGTVNVQVETEVNSDPARVATAFEEMAWKVLKNRRTARRPAFAGT